jgi:nucleotide-binding universal stress UspA family protein
MKRSMFTNILAPTDGSVMSLRAVARAIRLAREQKARVTALWVGPPWEPNLYAYDGDVPPGFVSPKRHAARLRKLAARRLAPVKKAAAAARVPCKCISMEGAFPFLEIVKVAKRHRCDLIVMASHGRRGISRLLLGSVTSNVLAYSPVPVLVVR